MFGNSIAIGRRNDVEPCGLCFYAFPKVLQFVPLRSVDVVAKCVHAVADVVVTQKFVNVESNPIEAVYYFPLDSNGAVVNFEAELNGKRIKGVAKAHEDAQRDYDVAIENYQTSFLGEETTGDIFKVSIGYLKPGNEAKIVLRYVTEVKNERGTPTIRFIIPTTIAPRYTPVGSNEKSSEVDNIEHSFTPSAPISILVYVGIQGEISSIRSPSHQIEIENKGVSPNNANWTQATVSLQSKSTDMDRDFVLLVTPEEAHRPRIYLEERPDSIAFMTHMIPSFRLDEQKRELIFVLDRSGSMGGQKIMLAQKALKMFLHSLPADCYFNIISFGNSYESLFKCTGVFSYTVLPYSEQLPQSAKYTNETMRYALSYADQLSANMGGTEILNPLQKIYQSEKISGYLRQVFLLTDGEVSNTDEIIGITKAHAHETRVFTLGIGNSASHHLVEGVAAAGGGTSNFVTENEPIDRKVLEQLKDAIEPALTDVKITWEGLTLEGDEVKINSPVLLNKEKTLMGYGKPLAGDTSAQVSAVKKYQQAPEKIPPLFDGSQSLIFGVFTDVSLKPTAAIITAETPDGPLSIRIEVSDSNKVGAVDIIHKLATIKIVKELEMKSFALSFGQSDVFRRLSEDTDNAKLKKEIIDIAVREGIASKYTSFIAVDSISNEGMESKRMVRRPVPSKCTINKTGTSSFVSTMTSSFGAFGTAPVSQKPMTGTLFGQTASNTVHVFGDAPKPPSTTQSFQPLPGFGNSQLFGSRSTPTSTVCFGSAQPTPFFGFASTMPVKVGNIVNNNTFDNKEEDKLYQIINFQSFDGSFIWDSNLIQFLGLVFDAVKREATKNGWNLVAWSTVLVITFLRTKLLDSRDSWDLLSEKAMKWLNKNYGTLLNVMEKQAIQLFNS